MRLTGILFLLLSVLPASYGQDFKSRYTHARELFDEGKFALASEAFKPLMVYDQANPYNEYAAFYYGLSSLKENFKMLAKSTFLGIEQNYPNWNQMDEVRYWLAFIYFEQGEYFRGMEKLSLIRNEKGQAKLKESFLSKIKDPEILRMLLEDFHDPVTAKLLIGTLLAQRKEETISEAKRLMGSYSFNESQFDIPQVVKPSEHYRVGVLFPFLAQTLEPTPVTKRNQYVLDLYLGMKLASDSLEEAGIPVELALYDTERNPDRVREILAWPELKSLDVIAGPLFNDELKPVREFSVATKIPMIHPVSNSPEYLNENPDALLFQPSWITTGKKSAEHLASLGIKKPCMIFYEKTARDSTIAHAFRDRANELKIPVVLFREVTWESSAVISSILTTPVKYDKWRNPVEFKLKKDSIGSVFVASDSELIFTKVIAAVDARDDDTLILGQETWLEKPGMDWIKFESLGIVLAAPNFHNPFSLNYMKFEQKYLAAHHSAPGLYARIGYEFMMFLAGQLISFGGSNLKEWISSEASSEGILSGGFNFRGTSDNQVVPFIRFKDGALVRVN
ncbi:MAG: hypothetical protein ACO3FI_09165 [Cyclobacteriaceae bacterium]